MPLGISIGKWESASLVSEIYSIIAAEILGFNIIKEFAETSRSQIFILAGCDRDAEAVPDMSSACGHQRRLHVALENWYHGTLSLAKWLSVVPHRPVSMGFLTYVGQDGLYISGASHRRGLDHGLALEYFRFYNKSWFDLEPYLPLVSQVDLDRLELCSISLLNNPEAMSSYFSATNDTEDEIMILDPTTNTSKVSFRCYKDKWWGAGDLCCHGDEVRMGLGATITEGLLLEHAHRPGFGQGGEQRVCASESRTQGAHVLVVA